jgi:hypothetical protein
MEKDKDEVKKDQEQEPNKETLSRRKAIQRIAGALAAAAATAKFASARPINMGSYIDYNPYSEIYGSHYTAYKDYYASAYHSYHSIYVPPPYSSSV